MMAIGSNSPRTALVLGGGGSRGAVGVGLYKALVQSGISSNTLIWTAGVKPSALLATLPCPRSKQGAVVVNEHLEVSEYPGVWALGDCAAVPDSRTGRPYPPTAQNAIRQGELLADNIVVSLRNNSKKNFSYRPVGVLASLGRRSAVAEIWRFKFSEFFAWWLWRTVYLFKLPGLERKLRVAMDWTLDLFFHRDIVLLKVFMNKTDTKIPLVVADSAPAMIKTRAS
jgi:NADH dehydrogenase